MESLEDYKSGIFEDAMKSYRVACEADGGRPTDERLIEIFDYIFRQAHRRGVWAEFKQITE